MKTTTGFIAIILAFLSFTANAQQGGMQQMFKQRLIDSLKFTEPQADSVMAVRMQFQPQMRQIMTNDSLSKDAKTQQINAIRDQEKARMANFLSADQIAKMQDMEQSMRTMRMQRATKSTNSPGGN